MKKVFLCLLVLGLLSGCAAFPTPEYGVDYAKVNAVENAANRFGTQVYWVNVPTKKVVPAAGNGTTGT